MVPGQGQGQEEEVEEEEKEEEAELLFMTSLTVLFPLVGCFFGPFNLAVNDFRICRIQLFPLFDSGYIFACQSTCRSLSPEEYE